MPDSIIEPIGIPELYADGFGDFTMKNGILRCVGYSMVKGQKLGVVRLVIPGEGAAIAAELTQAAMNGEQPTVLSTNVGAHRRH